MTQSGSAAEGAAKGILSVPGGVLLSVLDGLTAVELIRTVALTSRALTEVLKGEGRGPDLWGQGVLVRLQRFMPAQRFFAEPLVKEMPYAALEEDCEERLGEALARAGLDVNWAWGRALLPPRPRVHTEASFAAWAQAFACEACGEAGAARRQCASCGELLCLPCAHRCADDSRCGFALCGHCHVANSIPGRRVDADVVWEMEKPGLLPPPCAECPFSLQCPVHADEATITCESCCLTMCAMHTYDEATGVSIESCGTCSTDLCTRCSDFISCDDCGESMCRECEGKTRDQFFQYCSGCEHTSCQDCQREKGATQVCMECSDTLCDDCVSVGKGMQHCMTCSDSVCDACESSGGNPFDFCRKCYEPHCPECLPDCGRCEDLPAGCAQHLRIHAWLVCRLC
jgi:hypothetical protein